MPVEEKIDIDVYKVVFRAIAESDSLEIMASHLTQLLVAALEIKGSTLFALNPETQELEILASFGLSMKYLNKGPLLTGKSIGATLKKEPIVIRDVKKSHRGLKAISPYGVGSFGEGYRHPAGSGPEHRIGHDVHKASQCGKDRKEYGR